VAGVHINMRHRWALERQRRHDIQHTTRLPQLCCNCSIKRGELKGAKGSIGSRGGGQEVDGVVVEHGGWEGGGRGVCDA